MRGGRDAWSLLIEKIKSSLRYKIETRSLEMTTKNMYLAMGISEEVYEFGNKI